MEEAEGYYQRALPIDREVQNLCEEDWILLVLDKLFQMRDHLEEAEEYFPQSLAINREVQDQREEAEILRSLCELACGYGQSDDAQNYLPQALRIDRGDIQDQRGEGEVLHSLGELVFAQGQLQEAKGYYQKALGIAREVQNRRGEGQILRSLGKPAQIYKLLESARPVHTYRDVISIRQTLPAGEIFCLLLTHSKTHSSATSASRRRLRQRRDQLECFWHRTSRIGRAHAREEMLKHVPAPVH